MPLAVPGAVAHLFYIHSALNQGGVDREWLSPAFYQELADWDALGLQAASRPMHLAEIFRWEPTYLGFCDASRLGVGGVWLDSLASLASRCHYRVSIVNQPARHN